MLFEGGFSFTNFLTDVFAIFVFVLWFWLFITVASDLFRRHDVSGWGKAAWIILLVVFPYIGIFVYLVSQGRGMAERNAQRAEQAREQIRHVIGYSVADELEKLDKLRTTGKVTEEEYARLRARALQ